MPKSEKDLVVSFVLPDHYPTRTGPIGGFQFIDGVSVVPIQIADQARRLLVNYHQCTMHQGVYKPKKKIRETKPASRRAVSGVKLTRSNKKLE